MTHLPPAERQRRRRQRGRAIGIVLRDPAAIAALDAGVRQHGGPLAAVTHALVVAYGEHPMSSARTDRVRPD